MEAPWAGRKGCWNATHSEHPRVPQACCRRPQGKCREKQAGYVSWEGGQVGRYILLQILQQAAVQQWSAPHPAAEAAAVAAGREVGKRLMPGPGHRGRS